MKKENKIICGLWIGRSLSLMEQLSIKSFLANGHEYHLYVYGHVKNIPRGTVIKNADEILPKKKIFKYLHGRERGGYGGFADLFRLKILMDKGGIWVDLDTVCLKPFDFKQRYVFSSENSDNSTIKINSGIMKIPNGCEFIKICYDHAEKMDSKKLFHGQIGPDLVSFNVHNFKLEKFVMLPEAFCPVAPKNFEKLINPDFEYNISKKTYAIHLWNEKWRRQVKNKSLWNCIWERDIKRFFYLISGKLKRYSRAYRKFVFLIKGENDFTVEEDFNKNKIYDVDTLYGWLQRKYL